jgi:hypothetical protein
MKAGSFGCNWSRAVAQLNRRAAASGVAIASGAT